MSYIVHYWHKPTGRRAAAPMECPWHESSEYWWNEGNASCDCNRMPWAGWGKAASCVTREVIVKCVANDGTVLYQDDDWTEPENPA